MIIGRTLSKLVSKAQDFVDEATLGRGDSLTTLLRFLQDIVMPLRRVYRDVDDKDVVSYYVLRTGFGCEGPAIDLHDENIRCALSKAFESRRKREIDRRQGIPLKEYLNGDMDAGYSSRGMFGENRQSMNVRKLRDNLVRVTFRQGREADYSYLVSSDQSALVSEMEDNGWDRSIIPVLYKGVIF
jgi:hypothetical protein